MTYLFPWFDSNEIMTEESSQFLDINEMAITLMIHEYEICVVWLSESHHVNCRLCHSLNISYAPCCSLLKISIQARSWMVKWINLAVIPWQCHIYVNFKEIDLHKKLTRTLEQIEVYEAADGEFMVNVLANANCSNESGASKKSSKQKIE